MGADPANFHDCLWRVLPALQYKALAEYGSLKRRPSLNQVEMNLLESRADQELAANTEILDAAKQLPGRALKYMEAVQLQHVEVGVHTLIL